MSYSPTTWQTGDIVSSAKLNKIETELVTLDTDVDTLKSEINDIDDRMPTHVEAEKKADAESGLTWESGKFYVGTVGSTIGKSSYAALSCAEYGAVNKDDVFIVTARSIGSGYAIYITDDSDKIVSYFESPDGNSYYDNAVYKVPSNGKMYLNTATTNYLDGNKMYLLLKKVTKESYIRSPLYGIKWASIGDSIVEINSKAPQNWVVNMIDYTGVVNTNLAVSGSGFYRGSPLEGQTTSYFYSKIANIPEDTELITVCGSFNDLMPSPWNTLDVGTASDSGTSTIAGYMNAFFDALITAFPTVPIAVMMTSPWDSMKPGVTNSDNYVSVLKAICEKNGIPFLGDTYYGCNLKPWVTDNRTEYYTKPDGTVDGVHPNDKGHIFLYRKFRPFLESVVNELS